MKILKYSFIFIIILLAAFACNVDEDNLYSLDYVKAPASVNAIFDIEQDNTGLVTILPNSEGGTQYTIEFGDGDTTEVGMSEEAIHIYEEGTYQVKIIAEGITGLTADTTKELNVTFKAPENLVATITKEATNPKMVTVTATATFATIIDVYFGDVVDEEPMHVLPEEAATHTYGEAGDYIIKVIAKSAGSATTEYTETITIDAASDPVLLPIDFESFTVDYAYSDFGGASSSVVDNPDAADINTSDKVGQSIKTTGAETWAGFAITLGTPIDFTSKTIFKVKVYSPKVGAVVKLKFENLTDTNINIEVDATTTVANAWEELSYDISSIDKSNSYQKVILFFDFGNVGDETTYFFDDIKQMAPPTGGVGIVGTWKMAPEANSLGVGPGLGDMSWWAIDAAGVTGRACFFDDAYKFGADGSFSNSLGDDTWVEPWQGGTDACGTPVAPHDGSGSFTYNYDESAGTVTLNGKGAFLGIPKAFNMGELVSPADAPESITYKIELSENNTVMTIDIQVSDEGWWRYILVKDGATASSLIDGTWQLAPEAGALGVGPGQGDLSWWAIDDAGVTGRACFFDDTYVFSAGGTFNNNVGLETWVEPWQGGADACGTPVAPHDGSATFSYTYDEGAGTITLNGKGAFLGIPKAYNMGELASPADAPESITYIVELSESNSVMIVDIQVSAEGWWRYKLVKN